MRKTGKPFLVVINSRNPSGEAAQAVREHLQQTFGIEPFAADCQAMGAQQIAELFRTLLCAFPMQELRVYMPRWLDALEEDHPVKKELYEGLLQRAGQISSLGHAQEALASLSELNAVQDYSLRSVDLGEGTVSCTIALP